MCTDIENVNIKEIYKRFNDLNANKVAVRSSAVCEDSKENSFAGQFETILNVDKSNLITSINRCFKSSKNFNVGIYAKEKNILKNNTNISVIVQEMINGDISGVMFTNNPINGDNEIVIECVKGLGESLVQGEKTPTHIIVDRKGNIKRYLGDEILSKNIINELIDIAIKIEEHFAIPQDIEWTIKEDLIYVLQSRPITNIL